MLISKGRLFEGALIRGGHSFEKGAYKKNVLIRPEDVYISFKKKKILQNYISISLSPFKYSSKREVGLVVPAKYIATTDDKRFDEILKNKLKEKKDFVDIEVIEMIENDMKMFPC